MNETERSANYAAKRIMAVRNMETHIQKILFAKAKSIIETAKKYRLGNRISNEAALLAEARSITRGAAADIENYTSAYADAACKILNIDSAGTAAFVSGKIFGKTLNERNSVYLKNFAEDILRMIKAGYMMGYPDSKILSAIRTGYKDPYHSSVITKAQRKDINIATPSYGRGIFHNAYENIVRSSSQTISLAWGKAEQQYGKNNGAIAFKVYRGSSYPCAVCDDECAYIHSLSDPHPPFHINCVCFTKFIFKQD